jgi:hypothetical protein
MPPFYRYRIRPNTKPVCEYLDFTAGTALPPPHNVAASHGTLIGGIAGQGFIDGVTATGSVGTMLALPMGVIGSSTTSGAVGDLTFPIAESYNKLLEDGSHWLLETGDHWLTQQAPPFVLLEDNGLWLLEDGGYVELED